MITIHISDDLKAYDMLFKKKQHEISADAQTIKVKNLSYYTLPSVHAYSQSHIEQGLAFPIAVRQYNKHMGRSDDNTQEELTTVLIPVLSAIGGLFSSFYWMPSF